MMHTKRVWTVAEEVDPFDLAVKLTEFSWTLCTGFAHGSWVFLNDATSEDGAQEYAVIERESGRQIESVTASWMEPMRMLTFILAQLPVAEPEFAYVVEPWRMQAPDVHGRCRFCM